MNTDNNYCKKEHKYNCKWCRNKKALLRGVFITKGGKIRLKFYCLKCNLHFEITANGKEWEKLKPEILYSKSKIERFLSKIREEYLKI